VQVWEKQTVPFKDDMAMLGCGGIYVGPEKGKYGKRDDQIRRNEKKLSFRPMVTESEFKITS
jgi:hypothetical protein